MWWTNNTMRQPITVEEGVFDILNSSPFMCECGKALQEFLTLMWSLIIATTLDKPIFSLKCIRKRVGFWRFMEFSWQDLKVSI